MLWAAVYCAEGILIILGSAVTIAVFRRRRSALKRASYLLINLAIADLMVGLTVTLHGLGWLYPMYSFVTTVGYPLISLSITVSINSLVVIAIERAFAIVKPFKHRTAPTRYYSCAICFAWVLAAVMAIVFSLFMRGIVITKFIISLIYIASLMTILMSYLTIWWFSRKRKSVRGHTPNSKLTTTLSIVTFLSLATWAPLQVYALIYPVNREDFATDTSVLGLCLLQYANSLLNPFVYALRIPEFRQEITRLCSRKRRRAQDEGIPMADRGGVRLKSMEHELRQTPYLCTNIWTGRWQRTFPRLTTTALFCTIVLSHRTETSDC